MSAALLLFYLAAFLVWGWWEERKLERYWGSFIGYEEFHRMNAIMHRQMAKYMEILANQPDYESIFWKATVRSEDNVKEQIEANR